MGHSNGRYRATSPIFVFRVFRCNSFVSFVLMQFGCDAGVVCCWRVLRVSLGVPKFVLRCRHVRAERLVDVQMLRNKTSERRVLIAARGEPQRVKRTFGQFLIKIQFRLLYTSHSDYYALKIFFATLSRHLPTSPCVCARFPSRSSTECMAAGEPFMRKQISEHKFSYFIYRAFRSLHASTAHKSGQRQKWPCPRHAYVRTERNVKQYLINLICFPHFFVAIESVAWFAFRNMLDAPSLFPEVEYFAKNARPPRCTGTKMRTEEIPSSVRLALRARTPNRVKLRSACSGMRKLWICCKAYKALLVCRHTDRERKRERRSFRWPLMLFALWLVPFWRWIRVWRPFSTQNTGTHTRLPPDTRAHLPANARLPWLRYHLMACKLVFYRFNLYPCHF